jgi:hypothetical protein
MAEAEPPQIESNETAWQDLRSIQGAAFVSPCMLYAFLEGRRIDIY